MAKTVKLTRKVDESVIEEICFLLDEKDLLFVKDDAMRTNWNTEVTVDALMVGNCHVFFEDLEGIFCIDAQDIIKIEDAKGRLVGQ